MGFVEGALAVAGFVSGGILGILGILPDRNTVADPLSDGNSVVRIGIGQLPSALNNNYTNPYHGQDYAGRTPSIRVFNANSDFIGQSGESSAIGQGQWASIVIHHNGTGKAQQATSLELRGDSSDPICIAWLTETWSDGNKVGWLGDVGQFCNKRWYYSNLKVPKDNGEFHEPACTWFGGNGSAAFHHFQNGMRINTLSFGRLTGSGNDFKLPERQWELCHPPHMEWYQSPPVTSGARGRVSPLHILHLTLGLIGHAQSFAIRTNDGSSINRPNTSWQSTLISSSSTSHPVKKMCHNPNSWGPDFINPAEQMFCDMTTGKAWPLCNATIARLCFDANTHTLIDGRLRKREMKYLNVIDWD